MDKMIYELTDGFPKKYTNEFVLLDMLFNEVLCALCVVWRDDMDIIQPITAENMILY